MAFGMIIPLALGLSVFGLGIDKNFEKGECVLESFDRGLPEVLGEVALSVTWESTSVRPTVAACGSEDVTFATTSEKSVGGTGGVGAVDGAGRVGAVDGTGWVGAVDGAGRVGALDRTGGVGAEGGTDKVGVVDGTGWLRAVDGTGGLAQLVILLIEKCC